MHRSMDSILEEQLRLLAMPFRLSLTKQLNRSTLMITIVLNQPGQKESTDALKPVSAKAAYLHPRRRK